MNRPTFRASVVLGCAAAAAVLAACGSMSSMTGGGTGMRFFVSNTGSGKGADLGGLAGADRLCTSLATAAGAGNHVWRAYLSTQAGARGPGGQRRDSHATRPRR